MFMGKVRGRIGAPKIASWGTALWLMLLTGVGHTEPLLQSPQSEPKEEVQATSSLAASKEDPARKAYEMGVHHMREGELTIALTYFQTSQRLDADPKTTLMMASIESGMGHQTRAWKLLLETLLKQEKLDSDRLEAARELANIVKRQLGHLHLKVDRASMVLVDGQPLEKEPVGAFKEPKTRWLAGTSESSTSVLSTIQDYDILVDEGFHRVEVFVDGFYSEKRERSVRAGETIELDIRLARTFWRKASAGLMIAGGAGLVAGTGLFLAATSNKNAALAHCNQNWVCLPTGKNLLEKSKDAADAATVIIPASLIIGTTGLVYWLATFRPGHQEESHNAAGTIYPNLTVGRHESIFSLSGSF